MLKVPKFWYQPPGLLSAICTPIAAGYNLVHRLRQITTTPYKAKVPVICVGNFTVGGAGKTPTVMALVPLLQKQKVEGIHILTRGYGGSLKGPSLVDPQQHSFYDVGDEALLLAQVAPTWVGSDRIASARAAQQAGAKLILMDDGAQNPTLHKDLCVMVIDGKQALGNGCLFPAGPLREKQEQGLRRKHIVVMIGQDQHKLGQTMGKLVFTATIVPEQNSITQIEGKKLLAFAGLGFPDKFFQTLSDHGADFIETKSFPDHHPYREQDLFPLLQRAQEKKALLVTTEKDKMRVPASLQGKVTSFKIQLIFDNPAAIWQHFNTIPARNQNL